MPNSTFMSVLLPAPFSPTSAWMVPGRTARDTRLRTRLPSYSLVMSRSSRTGAVMRIARRAGGAWKLVGHVVLDHQPLVAPGCELAHPHLAAGLALEVTQDGGRVVEVGLVVRGVHQQVGERADRDHVDRLLPGAEVAAHPLGGDRAPVLGVDESHVPGLRGRDAETERGGIARGRRGHVLLDEVARPGEQDRLDHRLLHPVVRGVERGRGAEPLELPRHVLEDELLRRGQTALT